MSVKNLTPEELNTIQKVIEEVRHCSIFVDDVLNLTDDDFQNAIEVIEDNFDDSPEKAKLVSLLKNRATAQLDDINQAFIDVGFQVFNS